MALPTPTAGYEEAMGRLEALLAADGPEVRADCRAFALTHGRPTPKVALLLHGYTNCPRQMQLLAEELHARGLNVLVPRMPGHGLVDRVGARTSDLTAAQLLAFANQSLDIARGLGEEVRALGISAGGVLAAHLAQHRPELARAVLVGPSFGAAVVPAGLTALAGLLGRLLPDRYVWWDAKLREQIPGPDYAYPGWSTHTMAEFIAIGLRVARAARRSPPAARRVVVITSASDLAVSRPLIARVVRSWARRWQGVSSYEFPARLAVPHDCIDINQPDQRVALVYPVLIGHLLAG